MDNRFQKFLVRAKIAHRNKYDYSKVKYKNDTTKICIICPTHGEYWTTPFIHTYMKSNCPECGRLIRNKKNSLDKNDFLKKAKEMHGIKYDYSKVEYKNNKTKVCIICPEHGEFLQSPHSHIDGNRGCPVCYGTYKYSNNEWTEKARTIHNNKYDYSKVEYLSNKKKVCIICPEHGEFWQKAEDHTNKGCGCAKCVSHSYSRNQLKWLELISIMKPIKYALNDGEYRIPQTNYDVDGYDPETKTVYEFHGDWWHGNPSFYYPEDIHPVSKKKYGQLYKNTLKKELIIHNLGYNYVCIWEHEWLRGIKVLKILQRRWKKKMNQKKFPYQCKKCDFKCIFKSKWFSHISTEIHKTGKRKVRKDRKAPIRCSVCKIYESKNSINMRTHILNKHSTVNQRKDRFSYYCDCCDYGNFHKLVFQKHLLTRKHEKYKP